MLCKNILKYGIVGNWGVYVPKILSKKESKIVSTLKILEIQILTLKNVCFF